MTLKEMFALQPGARILSPSKVFYRVESIQQNLKNPFHVANIWEYAVILINEETREEHWIYDTRLYLDAWKLCTPEIAEIGRRAEEKRQADRIEREWQLEQLEQRREDRKRIKREKLKADQAGRRADRKRIDELVKAIKPAVPEPAKMLDPSGDVLQDRRPTISIKEAILEWKEELT
jgi:hypothetical protein